MTDRKLLEQALHAMLNFPNDISDEMFESIRSLKSALAEPEQELKIKTTDPFESSRVADYNRGWNDCLFASSIEKIESLIAERDALRARLAQPEQRPLINPPACTWKHDDDEGSWDAECSERWSIAEGTPEENNFRFCPGCGKTIKTIYSNRREVNDE